MSAYVALLRAVNVGGTGKLPMQVLRSICEEVGFTKVQTYIASGNVVFLSDLPEREVKAALEARLREYAGKPVGVVVRTATEMAAVAESHPFADAPPNRTVAIFLDEPPPINALDSVAGRTSEEIRLGLREIYIHYRDGMADTKLKIPAAKHGTARNTNTVIKLAHMASQL